MRGTNYHISRQLSIVSYFLILTLLFGSSIWPVILSKPKEAKATDANLHLLWTGSTAPDGWTIVSTDGGAFYQKFLKGSATYGSTGGAATHTHTVTTTITAASTDKGSTTGSTDSTTAHVHSNNTTVSDEDNLPSYKQIKVIKYTGDVFNNLPAGVVAMFDATPPAGWTALTTYNTKFFRCAEDASSTGGSSTPTHSVNTSLGYTIQSRVAASGADDTISSYDHTHTASFTTDSGSIIPPYIDVILASKDADGPVPVNMIGFFDATPTYRWSVISGSGGALNGKYIRVNSSYGGTGGTATHNHADSGDQTSTTGSSSNVTGRGSGGIWGDHDHTVTFTSFGNSNNDPPYIEVIFAKRQSVYDPRINNWRWYADEEDEDPETVYEAENTAPPQIEMGKSIGFKLRVNFTELAGVAGNNSRKKLQYSTSTSGPWTLVGSLSDTDKLFRYYDGGGDDNVALTTTKLTGSSATKGIHDESNSSAPSNSDHPASTTVEFEYCFENYNAVVNTTYYFSFNDEIAGDIPLGSGKSYPSLLTASLYTLTTSTPSAVNLGNWAIGSSAYAEYTFVEGEEITVRDNRGQTSGSSSGWSLTAEMTTELKNIETPSRISDPAFTGSGLNDMSIDGGSYFTGKNTVYYKVEVDDNHSPNTFKWSDDGGSTWDETNVPMTLVAYTLNNGVSIVWGATTGHTIGDYWTFTGTPEVANTILASDIYFRSGQLVGLYDAPVTGISSNDGEYMGSPVTVISVSGSGKQGLGGFTVLPSLRIYNASVVGVYEGVMTFTLT